MSRELKRVPWTPQEDERLGNFVARYGPKHWSLAPHRAQLLRDSMSCRVRWHFYLSPGIKRGAITPEEEEDIIRLHAIYGDNWFDIAWKLPGRTSKDVRNHWREHLSQRLVAQGIDPRTHKPLADAGSSQSSGMPRTMSLDDTSAFGLGITGDSPPEFMDINIDEILSAINGGGNNGL